MVAAIVLSLSSPRRRDAAVEGKVSTLLGKTPVSPFVPSFVRHGTVSRLRRPRGTGVK